MANMAIQKQMLAKIVTLIALLAQDLETKHVNLVEI